MGQQQKIDEIQSKLKDAKTTPEQQKQLQMQQIEEEQDELDDETIPETIPVSKRKESQPEPEGASAFGLKLKKSNRRQSQIPEEPKLPTVELKHHEFEKLPQTEEPEKTSQVILSKAIIDP